MRRLALLLIVALAAGPAAAQTPPPAPAHHGATTAPAAAAPAAGIPSSAIIPGSPLAALTGAAPAPAAQAPDPFGADSLGLSILDKVSGYADNTVGDFAQAVRRSTALTPVWKWLRGFASDSARRAAFADAVMGLVLTILPALVAESIIRFLLSRPREALIRYGLARRKIDFPPQPDAIDKAEIGDTDIMPPRPSAIAWLRRLGLALTYIFLALLPIIGFAATAGALLGTDLIATRTTREIITVFGNAYLFWRFSAEIMRFLFAPRHTDLRLIHTSDKRASWIVRAVSGVVITIAAGATIVSAAEILGLTSDGGRVLGLDIALAVHIEIAFMVWQGRRVVAGWIRGKSVSPRPSIGIRARLAAIWHFIALFYVLALWIAYAGGIHNAFGVLLRVILVFIGAMVAGRFAWFGVTSLLDRAFDDDGDDRPHPTLRARARAYNHLIKLVTRIIIGVVIVVLMVQGWGFNIVPWLLTNPLSRSLVNAFISIIITVAIALVLWELANGLLNSRINQLSQDGKVRQASRLRTLLPMLRASIGVIIFLTAALISLSKIGVNLVPLLAVSGVAGIAIGFGSQKLVQDIITGLFLLLEDAMQVGDTVTLAGMSGSVERLSIRTIRLRGGDGSINIIPFSAVTTVTNMTRDFGYAQISITISYQSDLDRVTQVLQDIGKTMRAEPQWGAQMRDDLQLFGLDAFGDYGLVIIGQIRTGPGQHWAVRREFYARVLKRFAAEGIQMPYNHQSLTLDAAGLPGIEVSKQGQGALPPGPPLRGDPLEPNSGR